MYFQVGDSAAWTGHALTALALQYNVTRNASLLPRVRSILDSYDRLTTCTGKVKEEGGEWMGHAVDSHLSMVGVTVLAPRLASWPASWASQTTSHTTATTMAATMHTLQCRLIRLG